MPHSAQGIDHDVVCVCLSLSGAIFHPGIPFCAARDSLSHFGQFGAWCWELTPLGPTHACRRSLARIPASCSDRWICIGERSGVLRVAWQPRDGWHVSLRGPSRCFWWHFTLDSTQKRVIRFNLPLPPMYALQNHVKIYNITPVLFKINNI